MVRPQIHEICGSHARLLPAPPVISGVLRSNVQSDRIGPKRLSIEHSKSYRMVFNWMKLVKKWASYFNLNKRAHYLPYSSVYRLNGRRGTEEIISVELIDIRWRLWCWWSPIESHKRQSSPRDQWPLIFPPKKEAGGRSIWFLNFKKYKTRQLNVFNVKMKRFTSRRRQVHLHSAK